MQNGGTVTTKKVREVSVRLVIVLTIFVAILLTFLFITNEFVLEGKTEFDAQAFRFLHAYTSTGTTSVMTFLTFFGSTKFLFPAYSVLVLFYTFYVKNTKLSFNIAAIGLTSMGLLKLIKNIFQRQRPPNPLIADVTGFSYPSGHSSSAFTLSGILIYILWKSNAGNLWKWVGTIVLLVFATLVAFSRVYLNVHYASDVIAGFCLAFLWLTICIYVLHKFNRSNKKEQNIAGQS
jgi:undecaprenyl-diphosphatase